MKLRRIDSELVRRGLAKSRSAAAQMIEDGRVKLDGQIVLKPARQMDPAQAIVVEESDDPEYVSRGAHKLAGALDALGDKNPLPNAYEVTVRQPDMVETAAKQIERMDGVESAKYGQDVVEHLFDITRLVRLFGVLLILLLGGATIFIIANTIRLTVFARRREIAIMKYVGATDEFIRWPFVLEGIVLGFIGGVISALVLRSFYAGVVNKVYDTLAFFPLIPQSPFMTYVGIVIVLLGMAIGAAGAWVSLKRFLKV